MRTVADPGGRSHGQQHDPGGTEQQPAQWCGSCGQPVGFWGTDRLTGLADRWGWDLQAPRFHYEAIRFGRPVTVLAVDLDRFKQVNDRYGHLAGDAVLHATGDVLRRVADRADLIARYGGDEFLVLSSGCDTAAATALADRLADSLATMTVTTQATRSVAVTIDNITASIGVAVQRSDDDSSLHELVLDADTALRQAKRTGRGDVVPGLHALKPFAVR
ncbi:MAG TPA: GGDEF domain-containing protein [Pseudonocardiaceae bacterium]|jgi:diguanylate cyclase (GGDEF)-like protein